MRTTTRPESVTSPTTAASRSHLSNTASTSASRPLCTTMSMRSCDSDSMSSYAVMPSSRTGTFSRSRTTPVPARAAISTDDDVRPAAPMSWIPTRQSVSMSSWHASRSSFSMNGSPTCTVGRFSSVDSSNSADAMVAP